MRRLFDDPQLPAALRHDLQQSRAAGQDYAVSEKLLQLRAALSDDARQPLGSRWSKPLRVSHPVWKVLSMLTLAGTGALAVQHALPQKAPPLAAAEVVAAPPPPPAAEVVDALPAPPTVASVERVRPPPTAAKTPGSSSRREIAQLVRIRELLKKDPAAAYELAQRSEREFPAGLLSEERQALAIMALAKTSALDDARRRANAFFLRYPQSPMREQIEAALVR